MSRIARQNGAPDSAPGSAQPQTDGGLVAHPKIARRPTNWKRPIQEIDAPVKKSTATANAAPLPSGPTKAWQDDPNFGIALIAIVLILNIILMSIADSPEKPKAESSLMIQQVTRESVLPTQRSNESNTVRMFANPHDAKAETSTDERTTRQTIYDSISKDRFTKNEIAPGFESNYEER